jgi:hypothetical protein
MKTKFKFNTQLIACAYVLLVAVFIFSLKNKIVKETNLDYETYKVVEKVEDSQKEIEEKECGHIFLNKYCRLCKEYRLRQQGF